MKMKTSILIILLATTSPCFATLTNVVTNPGFEMAADDTLRPPYWMIGFIDSAQDVLKWGCWSFDSHFKTEGSRSIKLESYPDAADNYTLSQILDINSATLKGKTVELQIDIAQQGFQSSPLVLLFAVNETLPPDPELGIGLAGDVILLADSTDGTFHTYSGSFTAKDAASFIALACVVPKEPGAVWIDNVRVTTEVDTPISESIVMQSPIAQRSFQMGFVQENSINMSEKAKEDVIRTIADHGEFVNIFFHTRWCSITGDDIQWGHQQQLKQAELARELGLDIILTLDFTHDTENEVGDINFAPDGSTVGSLNDEAVWQSYYTEMLALCELVEPEYVVVGVEANIFYERHPDQWPAYVHLFKSLADTLTQLYPDIHVTSYFTIDWMTDPSGHINMQHADIWKQLMPELQSVAYSFYPAIMGNISVTFAPGYFAAPAQIAPELPVIIPECGAPGGIDISVGFDKQVDWLSRMVTELSSVNAQAISWFSVYDQTYFGVPEVYRNAFNRIGMFKLDGSAKPALALWDAVLKVNRLTSAILKFNQSVTTAATIRLYPNYPNPFNAHTRISYDLPKDAFVNIQVLNLLGQTVRVLVNESQRAGNHSCMWDGSDQQGLPIVSGIYLVKLQVDDVVQVRKICLVK
ncbi:T9SS type A sorting domain-containing protein [candidate division KSB1 bacterium]|nr:T9SS type A sorting domain-containing protein [candidate division KSB1 bacterium]